ncbi:hypothetical protein [Candidatus Nitrospira allomarina]|uniref:Outer membrane beta-barrel protein n=1 Tax=Candidatus Nitrospira allomarina TaxID=3020900 RepID=A0AA96GC93_9BACT|nr:hypothetical protein [Candidatus Nitrospira allomarina]WNM59123.1 hypothetical protein PP769_04995 [Candidatus Nitrospira allomarina]
MVRTVLWLVMGCLLLPFASDSAFSADTIPHVDRLGLRTDSHSNACGSPNYSSLGRSSPFFSPSTPCTVSKNEYALTRFNFNQKREPFNLQNARDMPSLVSQGGSSLYEASNDIPLFHDALSAGVQMMYRDPFVTDNSATPLTNRMGAQIVLKGTTASMKYQAQYGFSGQETGNTSLTTPNDRVGGKLAWEWNLPFVTPQIELSRFTSNVEGDLSRSQTVANQQKFSLLLSAPNWPSLSLGYARQQKDIFTRPEGPLSNVINTETVSANMSFLHGAGKGDWSSYYKTSQSEYGENGSEEEFGSKLGGTLNLLEPVDLTPQWGFIRRVNSRGTMANDRFFAKLGSNFRVSPTSTLKPGIEFARDLNRFDALRTDTLAAKLGYAYLAVDDSLHVSILGQYILNQRSNIPANPQIYDVSLLFKKDVRDYLHLNHRQQTLSLKIAHNQQMNNSSFQTQYGQTSAMLLVSIIP